jgi:hypothetical protein
MCTADAVRVSGDAFDGAADALRMVGAALEYLNSPAVADLDGSTCGELLIGLGEVQAKLTAAHAAFLRRFDAANAHDTDGYGSSFAWLSAKAGMSKGAARESVRRMRQLGDRPLLGTALADGDITESLAFTIADWTRKLPAEMRTETDRILLEAAAAGASMDDLATIAACAIEKWRQQQADPGNPDDAFEDRYVQVGTTFGGAGVIRGNPTPECAATVRAVVEALGKKAGPEDDRTEQKRFHDALQLACELLLRARLGEDGYLTGKDAEAAAGQIRRAVLLTMTCVFTVEAGNSSSTPTARPRPAAPTASRSSTATPHPPGTPPDPHPQSSTASRSSAPLQGFPSRTAAGPVTGSPP